MADSKISALTDGSPLQASDELVIARGAADYKIPGTAMLTKLFDQTLGADAASLDTLDGGVNTNYSALLILAYIRSTASGPSSGVNLRFNNDSGANYTYERINIGNTSLAGARTAGGTAIGLDVPAASATANFFGILRMFVYKYANGTHYPWFEASEGTPSDVATNAYFNTLGGYYASTTAISRVALSGSSNLKAGSSLEIYGLP